MLDSKACRALHLYLKERVGPTHFAFFINRFGKPLGPRGIEKIINKCLKQADILDASAQSLQHTFGVYHASKGANMRTIQDAMGYKGMRSTTTYLTLAREKIEELRKNTL